MKSRTSHRESAADRATRADAVARGILTAHPDAHCALVHESPFQLLVATILSAQCTDERVNLVTRDLFARVRGPEDVLALGEGELEALIRSTGFYNAKAKNIRGACRLLVDAFGGRVPRSMEELLRLPGVARKTANVVLGTGFGIRSGFVVDTHVHRLARRLGLTKEDDPEKIERDLCALLPDADWVALGHALIFHGRRLCSARAPRCGDCSIAALCPSEGAPADAWKRDRDRPGAADRSSVRPSASRAASAARPSPDGTPRSSRGRRDPGAGSSRTPGAVRDSDSTRPRRRS